MDHSDRVNENAPEDDESSGAPEQLHRKSVTVSAVTFDVAEPAAACKPSFKGQLDAHLRIGMTILPLHGKTPRDGAWQKRQYDSKAVVIAAEKAGYNLGVRLSDSGWLVVDVDPRNGGDESFERLQADAGINVGDYPVTRTGGGGLHVWMFMPQGVEAASKLDDYPGIDFKTSGQVVAPGSVHPKTGRHYVGERMDLLAFEPLAPNALADLLSKSKGRNTDGADRTDRTGEWTPKMLAQNLDLLNPDDFADYSSWLDVLMAAHHATAGEGLEQAIEWSNRFSGIAADPDLIEEKWNGFNASGGGITVRHLYKLIHDRGLIPIDRCEPEDEFEVWDEPAPKKAERWTFLSLEDLEQLPPPQWLVHGFIQEETLIAIYGAPESGKSFLAIDMAMSVATDRRWHGREVMQGAVLYIAAEGAMGLSKRVRAWKAERGVNGSAPFHLMRQNLNLTDSKEAIAFCRQMTEKLGSLRMIVIDTLNQTASGADENSAQDMGRYIESMKRMRDESGAAVAVIHHSGKDATKGLRGSSALLGGFDTTIEVVRPNLDGPAINVRVRKQKDAEKEHPIGFEMVQLGESLVLRVTKDSIRESDEAFVGSPLRDWAAQQVLARGGRMTFKALLVSRMELTLGKESTTRNELKAALIDGYDSAKATPCSDGSIVWRVRQAGNSRGELEVLAKLKGDA